MGCVARSPYTGRRLATASAAAVPDIEVERLVARYQELKNVSQCARELGIGRKRCRSMLERAGVLERAGQEAVDEDAVLRAYDRLGSVDVVARLQGLDEGEVREILNRHRVPRPPHGELPSFSGKGTAPGTRPGDLPPGSPGAPERSTVR